MIELLAVAFGLAVAGGALLLVLGLLLVPLYLAFKIVGFGLRLIFGLVGLVLGGVILLPLLALVGGLLLLKLLILAAPLLLLLGGVWLLIHLTRRPEPPSTTPSTAPEAG